MRPNLAYISAQFAQLIHLKHLQIRPRTHGTQINNTCGIFVDGQQ